MARRKGSASKAWSGGRGLTISLALVGVCGAIGLALGFGLGGGDGSHSPGPEDRAAIRVAEQFLDDWTHFDYGDALLVSTGDTRERVLEAMEKELALEGPELEVAAALRAKVADIRMELVVHSVEDLGGGEKRLHVTALAREGGEVFEREQTFRLRHEEDGWKVASWDTGHRPGDKRR